DDAARAQRAAFVPHELACLFGFVVVEAIADQFLDAAIHEVGLRFVVVWRLDLPWLGIRHDGLHAHASSHARAGAVGLSGVRERKRVGRLARPSGNYRSSGAGWLSWRTSGSTRWKREPNRRPPPDRSREERTQLQSSSFLISGSVTEAQLITQPKLNGDESCYAFIYCRRPNGPTL